MKISFVTDRFGSPSHYVRLWAPLFYHASTFLCNDYNVVDYYDVTADVIVFERPFHPQSAMVREAYSKGKKILFEFDDPLWLCAQAGNAESKKVQDAYTRCLKSLIKYASGVVVSTKNLAYSFRENINDKIPVFVLENGVQEIVEPKEKNHTIFYGGCTNDKLKMFSSAWYDALEYFRKEEGYKIVSSVDIPVEHEHFDVCCWPNYLANVAKYAPEIYVAPLAECEESKCKSDLKELEAWQLGAKFVGQGEPYSNGLPYDASEVDIIRAINSAKVPEFSKDRLMNSHKFACNWISVYKGEWC